MRIDIDPRGQGRPRAVANPKGNRGRCPRCGARVPAGVYELTKDGTWKTEFGWLARSVAGARRAIQGPASVLIRAAKRLPKRQKWTPWRVVTPDVDNVAKIVLDVLTRLQWWHDDRQVSRLIVESTWAEPGDRGHLEIEVEEL